MTDFKTVQFLTCGHVDDGKSTLIGRLLYNLNVIPDDQIAAAKDAEGHLDYSLFTDGLEDERKQGITIDVAYRYFRHEGVRYRIADTPGHLQYMRNMAVAAVSSDIALLLIDGIHGVRLQTVQYSKIARFFGVRYFIVAINKMDAVEYSQAQFDAIKKDYLEQFFDDVSAEDSQCKVEFIPVSALIGDNVTEKSNAMPWYKGATLLDYLRNTERINFQKKDTPLALPVQHVIKNGDERWYLGTLTGGQDKLKVGDPLICVDNQQNVTVKGLYYSHSPVDSVLSGQAIAVSLNEDIDLSRGSVLSKQGQGALSAESLHADILWLDQSYEDQEAVQGTIKLHHFETQAQITVHDKNTVLKDCFVQLGSHITMDVYEDNPQLGLFLLVDMYSERTIGVGAIKRIIPDQYKGASMI